jgi:bacteriocin biosynthesis cyclodehydratase domain-containing protein
MRSDQVNRHSSIKVLARGPFGHAVAQHLGALAGPGRCHVEAARPRFSSGLRTFLAGGTLGILATHRDVTADLEAFAAAAELAGRPWVPVALSPGYVRVGPLTIPGAAPCPACYSARRAQHGWLAPGREQSAEPHDDLGVQGFPPHLAAMAAGLALAIASPAAGPGPARAAGALFLIDLATDAVSSWTVIPADGCPVCDPAGQRSGKTAAGVERLRAVCARSIPQSQEMKAS